MVRVDQFELNEASGDVLSGAPRPFVTEGPGCSSASAGHVQAERRCPTSCRCGRTDVNRQLTKAVSETTHIGELASVILVTILLSRDGVGTVRPAAGRERSAFARLGLLREVHARLVRKRADVAAVVGVRPKTVCAGESRSDLLREKRKVERATNRLKRRNLRDRGCRTSRYCAKRSTVSVIGGGLGEEKPDRQLTPARIPAQSAFRAAKG